MATINARGKKNKNKNKEAVAVPMPALEPAQTSSSGIYCLTIPYMDERDNAVRLWDAVTADLLWTIPCFGVGDCCFCPQTNKLAVAFDRKQPLTVWDAVTGQSTYLDSVEYATSCQFNLSGSRLLCYSVIRKVLSVWNSETRDRIFYAADISWCSDFLYDGTESTRLAFPQDGVLFIRNFEAEESLIAVQDPIRNSFEAVSGSSGQFFAVRAVDEFGVWELPSGIRVFHEDTPRVSAICFADNDSLVVAVHGIPKLLSCWRIADRSLQFSISLVTSPHEKFALSFSPQRSAVVVNTVVSDAVDARANFVHEYDFRTGAEVSCRAGILDSVRKFCVGPQINILM
jgi:WD40 repeat protein